MNIKDQYLDTTSISSLRSGVRPTKSQTSFNIQSRAQPSLSINLDNTIVQTIIPPVNNSLSGDIEDNSLLHSHPRLRSMQSISSIASRRTTRPNTSSDQLSVNTSFNPIIEQSFTYCNNNNNNIDDPSTIRTQDAAFGEEIRKDLIDRLAQSIYSYPTSLAGNTNEFKPVVSNEIPDVFINDNQIGSTFQSHAKNFFILTSAGKPIFSMFGEDKEIIPYMGIINTVVSYFQINESTNIKTIKLNKTKQTFAFTSKAPIILMAYSRRGETTNELMTQLDLLYSYLISSINERQLKRLFHNRSNFDLRNFLEVTDFDNLRQICSLLSNKLYPDFGLNALQCFVMRKNERARIHDTIHNLLINENKNIPRGTLLYGLILSYKRKMFKLCAVIRPKGHSLHTIDLQLLFSLITHQFENRDGDQELWLPICFPKFNSNGFLYSYIKYLSRSNSNNLGSSSSDIEDTVLVLISAQKDAFYKLKTFGDKLWNKLQSDKLNEYFIKDRFKFRISDIQAPLVHHFMYKIKKYVQYVMPEIEIHNDDTNKLNRYENKLKKFYGHLYNSVVDDNGLPINKTILNYLHWEEEEEEEVEEAEGNEIENDFQREKINMMGLIWITPQFELYLICNNGVNNKEIVLRSAKRIISWCKKYESRLFIQEGATF
ncbi:similar to Saccharomyces cerevisiae YGL124C MON1 Protein required for fusion of cvt-vesicles and autophagosomes with the vacuole [Maudiozyma saulgeensis]|uniref:Vacuolar fusion protein MON1 n=1 Tax=Maudiozyma saulgeensis TaxID=1789683 RepID=A0A1X7R6D0_9SACH|nr:similar to Saccharomyces cerevisiae YGL124C MON1 Protein required for fusion of cvt-vesicles and autophagosomes with the vacuole [Kazachstania saulgeensis]